MKKILCTIALGTIGYVSQGQGFIESFDYAPGANVGGNCNAASCDNNNWVTINETTDNNSTIDVVAGSLSYIGHFTSTGNKLRFPDVTGGTTRDIARATNFVGANWTSVYFSFLLQVTDDTRLRDDFNDQGNFIAFSNGTLPNGGGPTGRVAIRKEGNGFRLGIKNSGSGDVYTELPVTLDYGFSHLVVVKYRKVDGGNPEAKLWVNPTGAGIGVDGDPVGGVSNNANSNNPNNLLQVQIRTTNNIPTGFIDEIRTGYALSDVVPAILLPVDLLQISGHRIKTDVMLNWTTVEEINNRGFDIERSVDGSHFTKVGYLPSRAAAGRSSVPLDYQFADMAAPQQKLFYRLRQTDFDGQTRLSKMIMVTAGDLPAYLAAFNGSNMVSSEVAITLTAASAGKAFVRVVDREGRTIATQSAAFAAGNSLFRQDVGQLASGMYFIQVSTEGWQQTLRFVKQ